MLIDTHCHLANDEDIDNFLKSCDNVLRNKGLLIIDIFNPDMRFLNIKEIKEYRCPQDIHRARMLCGCFLDHAGQR